MTQDFLSVGIAQTDAWKQLTDAEFSAFRDAAGTAFARIDAATRLNEAQSESELIHPVLRALGWTLLPQEQANTKGRADVPDTLLFATPEAGTRALAESKPERRFTHGHVIVESKRWLRPLDRASGPERGEQETPSSQMLRYLTRAEAVSDRSVMWGILTNGRYWRLYWQGARSRSEEFLELDLADLSGAKGLQRDLLTPTTDPTHALRVFFLVFRASAFLPQAGDAQGRTFHRIALDESRHWEARVSTALGDRVFNDVFPRLVAALVEADPKARPLERDYREDAKRATLILLYRLLFVLFAEDRDLLPARDRRYDDYSLRRVRQEIADRIDRSDTFAATMRRYWQHLADLFRAIAVGEPSIGLPAYNGGLFENEDGGILSRVALGDAVVAPTLDALSREAGAGERRQWINYRDLSVQQLGSIYERLLEQAVEVDAGGQIVVRPASFARRVTGSYYTHDDLVKLLIRESLEPLIAERRRRFTDAFERLRMERGTVAVRRHALEGDDLAAALLGLKICDPAMGSGHFLVSLVDFLADEVLEASAEAASLVNDREPEWRYESPVLARVREIRARILQNARAGQWTVDESQLDDRHVVRRMILKRVIHGADKNPMAVELAKLSLWLHTFTVGAPLSFLDHHLRCGDALFGESLAVVTAELRRRGGLFAENDLVTIGAAVNALNELGEITDVDVAEVHESQRLLEEAQLNLRPLRGLLDLWHAIRWLAPLDAPRRERGERHAAVADLLSGHFGRNLLVLANDRAHATRIEDAPKADAINALLAESRRLAADESFLHWELAFPTAWRGLETGRPQGGFDVVIGNPPWDRMKLQQVEWFAERRPEIAKQARAADRTRMIKALESAGDPLWQDYVGAAARAETMAKVARASGYYPLLSGGDVNLYSLFVERASAIVRRDGIVALLVPSGIAGDLGAAKFFRSMSTSGRLGALFDFENRKGFFPDVDSRFKFCALVFGGAERTFGTTRSAFYLHRVDELAAANRLVELTAADFAAVNPNTGTAPIFRTPRDAAITTGLYRAHPVMVDRRPEQEKPPGPVLRAWPAHYATVFHMTNDSASFKRRDELESEGWYPIGGAIWRRGAESMLPLFVGRMIHQFDHRASSVTTNEANLHNAAVSSQASEEQKRDPAWAPQPQYWVDAKAVQLEHANGYCLAFRDIARATDARTCIAAVIPSAAAGNTLPLILLDGLAGSGRAVAISLLLANLNAMALDYIARQKVQSTHLNWYIVEQLPFVAQERFNGELGTGTIADLICREVLRLSYTAHDLAPFARDLGYDGLPFAWDPEDRRHRMARLDALFFRLYGLDRDDAAYILGTFPIVQEADERAFGRYRTRDLILGYMNALAAGDIDSVLAT